MSAALEAAVFEKLVPEMQAEGFDVYVHPSAKQIPAFLGKLRPDVIAYKGDRKVLVEIMTASAHTEARAEHLRALVADQPGWELRVIYAPPYLPTENVPVSTRQMIETQIERIEAAFDAMGGAAALLLAWAVFEAAARALIPEDFGRPQPPARLLEVLASRGYITPVEALKLRHWGQLRNAVAHGKLDLAPSKADVLEIIGAIRELLAISEPASV